LLQYSMKTMFHWITYIDFSKAFIPWWVRFPPGRFCKISRGIISWNHHIAEVLNIRNGKSLEDTPLGTMRKIFSSLFFTYEQFVSHTG
jgi:hypothetical protein